MADIHHSYVAGRYRDGALSDTWTDVLRLRLLRERLGSERCWPAEVVPMAIGNRWC